LADIAGLLIAGGRSLRFGDEKAVAPFCGSSLMDASVRAFSNLPAVAVSARPGSGAERRAHELGLQVVYDDPAFPSGPLAGLAAGLLWARGKGFARVATAPCDTPFLPGDVVARLAGAMGKSLAAYAMTSAGAQALCALWRVEALDIVAHRLRTGVHPAVRAVLAECGAVAVQFEAGEAFANANTKADLATLEQRL